MRAYNEIGDAAEQADDPRNAPGERWLAVWRGVRDWALANRHEYALLFGTPVPGYAAPHITVEVAGRMPLVLARIVADAEQAGALAPPPGPPVAPEAVNPDMLVLLRDTTFGGEQTARLVLAWNRLVGILGFELHGHLVNVTADDAAFFDYTARTEGAFNGLAFD
jgi:hypothetical protein